jgi:hypothetical protein
MFSHGQLVPINGLRVTVASLVLSPSGDGYSCADLVSEILHRLSTEPVRGNFVNQVVKTLGDSWNTQRGFRYDHDQAAQGLRFFNAENIPKIVGPIPPNVHGVKYQSDLQVVAEMAATELESRDELSLAVFGRE